MQTLSENPPLLAPEGFFDEEELQLYKKSNFIEILNGLKGKNVRKEK